MFSPFAGFREPRKREFLTAKTQRRQVKAEFYPQITQINADYEFLRCAAFRRRRR
jgi:hypothetical protein